MLSAARASALNCAAFSQHQPGLGGHSAKIPFSGHFAAVQFKISSSSGHLWVKVLKIWGFMLLFSVLHMFLKDFLWAYFSCKTSEGRLLVFVPPAVAKGPGGRGPRDAGDLSGGFHPPTAGTVGSSEK